MHNLRSYSAYSIKVHVLCWKIILPDCHSTLVHGRTQSHTVRHHCTRSDMVEHHHTDILMKNCRTQSNTVVHTTAHGRTWSHRRPYMYTVAQKILSCQNVLWLWKRGFSDKTVHTVPSTFIQEQNWNLFLYKCWWNSVKQFGNWTGTFREQYALLWMETRQCEL